MKKAEYEIDEWFIPPGTAEKLRLTARPLLPGLITLHEEHIVRTMCGYKLNEWYDLTPRQRALEVAIRRLEALVDRHMMEAENK